MAKPKKKVFTFKEQIKFGNTGETNFLNFYSSEGIEKSKTRDYDFIITATNEPVELKTDSWKEEDTPNFFIERYSDAFKESPGSVWQSSLKGVKFFCYYYINSGTIYWFEIVSFLKFLEEKIKTLKPIKIFNKGYDTIGYKILRADCEPYIIRKDKI